MLKRLLARKSRPAPAPRKPELAAPMLWAAEQCAAAEVVRLVDEGAPLDARNKDSMSALHLLIRHQDTDAALALIERGADVNASTDDGIRPIHIAASHGMTEVITALLKAGADVNVRTHGGFTALHFAKRGAVARVLIAEGIDISVRTNTGQTALEITHADGRRDVESAILNAISLRSSERLKKLSRIKEHRAA